MDSKTPGVEVVRWYSIKREPIRRGVYKVRAVGGTAEYWCAYDPFCGWHRSADTKEEAKANGEKGLHVEFGVECEWAGGQSDVYHERLARSLLAYFNHMKTHGPRES
ncbi:hypothetical protein [Paraburkholderia unamae]|uniref:Uncharacterized protein n=1 Tax=Paraburkholderia unamae TaxID=219649 RepID=A0ACC6RGU6_9BURK